MSGRSRGRRTDNFKRSSHYVPRTDRRSLQTIAQADCKETVEKELGICQGRIREYQNKILQWQSRYEAVMTRRMNEMMAIANPPRGALQANLAGGNTVNVANNRVITPDSNVNFRAPSTVNIPPFITIAPTVTAAQSLHAQPNNTAAPTIAPTIANQDSASQDIRMTVLQELGISSESEPDTINQ